MIGSVCNEDLYERLSEYTEDWVLFTFFVGVSIDDGCMSVTLSPVMGENTVHAERFYLGELKFFHGLYRTGECWDCFASNLLAHLVLLAAKGSVWREKLGDTPFSSVVLDVGYEV